MMGRIQKNDFDDAEMTVMIAALLKEQQDWTANVESAQKDLTELIMVIVL